MHSRHKAHIDTPDTEVELQRTGIQESLRQLRMRKHHQTQVVPKQRQAPIAYGNVPNDLDRIAFATTEDEVLDLLNQVLEVLSRSGRMAELPEVLRMGKLTNLQEARIALSRLQGEHVGSDSDTICVLRAVLTVAEERVRQLRQRE